MRGPMNTVCAKKNNCKYLFDPKINKNNFAKSFDAQCRCRDLGAQKWYAVGKIFGVPVFGVYRDDKNRFS
jgi:hypothetical protein